MAVVIVTPVLLAAGFAAIWTSLQQSLELVLAVDCWLYAAQGIVADEPLADELRLLFPDHP